MALDATALTLILLGVVVGGAGLAVPALRGLRRRFLAVAVLLVAAGVVFGLVGADEALDVADAPVLGWVIAYRSPGRTAFAETVSLVGAPCSPAASPCSPRWSSPCAGTARARSCGSSGWRSARRSSVWSRSPSSAPGPGGHPARRGGHHVAAVGALPHGRARGRSDRRRGRDAHAGHAPCGRVARGRRRAGPRRRAPRRGEPRLPRVHWTTDVLAGWLLGAALAVACLTVARLVEGARPGPERTPGDERTTTATTPPRPARRADRRRSSSPATRPPVTAGDDLPSHPFVGVNRDRRPHHSTTDCSVRVDLLTLSRPMR